jgi:tRNA dimethylallyltransferase
VERNELKQRIELRTERMIEDGLLDEVKKVLARGYSDKLKSLQSLGYKQVIGFLNKKYGWNEAVNLIKRGTWQYARRQMTWFNADKEINWFDLNALGEMKNRLESYWKK